MFSGTSGKRFTADLFLHYFFFVATFNFKHDLSLHLYMVPVNMVANKEKIVTVCGLNFILE